MEYARSPYGFGLTAIRGLEQKVARYVMALVFLFGLVEIGIPCAFPVPLSALPCPQPVH